MHPVATALIPWFRERRRDLPWRREPRDPYAVWVSEAMLQQTQVATVVPYFERFLARFPDVATLAAAPEEDVLKAWEGLGYYSRARHLHAAARAVVAQHGGVLPADLAALRALPGVGPYTAGAVASLAFGIPAPAVDGNVQRVAARVACLGEDVGTPAGRRAVEARVREWLPTDAPGAFNEALMELGATVCTPRAPRCGECPLRAQCGAHLAGTEESFPAKARRSAPAWEERVMLVARRGDAVWLVRPQQGLLAGLWGFPTRALEEGDEGDALAAALAEQGLAGDMAGAREVARFRKVFTHRRWRVAALEVRIADGQEQAPASGEARPEGRWVPLAELAGLALGDPSRQVAERLAREREVS